MQRELSVGPNGHDRSAGARTMVENLEELNFSHLLYFWAVARDGSIANACKRLNISQPTISMQIRKLEKTLGQPLFDRAGRGLVLTAVGHTVFDYADEMFLLGRELLGTLRGLPGKRCGRLQVGIPTFLPKMITYRLLEPVLQLDPPVQIVCHEAELAELLSGLAMHKYDVILTDTPVHSAANVRAFSHSLGESDTAICGVASLAAKYRTQFPKSLAHAPMLLPSTATAMRRSLDLWFDETGVSPQIVAEFDDSALMKEFGAGGAGLFPVPSAVLPDVVQQYRVEVVGRLPKQLVRYYAVTTERKLTHPATMVIAQNVKSGPLTELQR